MSAPWIKAYIRYIEDVTPMLDSVKDSGSFQQPFQAGYESRDEDFATLLALVAEVKATCAHACPCHCGHSECGPLRAILKSIAAFEKET